jgi:hypothetical protein
MNITMNYLYIFAFIATASSVSFCSNYPSNNSALFIALLYETKNIGTIKLATTSLDLECSVIDQTSSCNADIEAKKRVAMVQLKQTLKNVPSFQQGLAEGQRNICAIIIDADKAIYDPPYQVGIAFKQNLNKSPTI